MCWRSREKRAAERPRGRRAGLWDQPWQTEEQWCRREGKPGVSASQQWNLILRFLHSARNEKTLSSSKGKIPACLKVIKSSSFFSSLGCLLEPKPGRRVVEEKDTLGHWPRGFEVSGLTLPSCEGGGALSAPDPSTSASCAGLTSEARALHLRPEAEHGHYSPPSYLLKARYDRNKDRFQERYRLPVRVVDV